MLCGYFLQYNSRWVDGSPIRFLDWFGDSPGDYMSLNRTIKQFLPKMTSFKLVPSEEIDFHKMSMRSSLSEWCTGVVFTTHGHPLGMIKIRCDIKMQASYFCQNRISPISTSPHIAGGPYHFVNASWQMYRCEDNWLQIENTCFIMIKLQETISWRKMNQRCEQRFQASLVAFTNTNDNADLVVSQSNVNDMVRNLLLFYRQQGLPADTLPLDVLHRFRKLNYGMGSRVWKSNNTRIEPREVKYKNLLALLMKVRWPMRTYVKLNNKPGCYFLKESQWKTKKNFIVENVSCGQDRRITDLVCQRDWHLYTRCKDSYHTCADGTCVLREYRCDGNKDCHHGDDEIGCASIKYLTNVTLNLLEKHKVRLFSVLCSSFDNDIESDCLQQHSVCDNIYDISYESSHCENKTIRPAYYRELNNNDNSLMKENAISFFQRCTFRTGRNYSSAMHVFKRSICDTVKCPFMFRCEHSYCIPIEKVCDGELDCPYGADESSCEEVSCPGMLKCRGENRCLPDYLICNNIVDCTYTTDDELYCQPCPKECVCSGHSLLCSDTPPRQSASLYKKIILKSNLSTVFDLSWTGNATFLDVSFCHVRYLYFKYTSVSLLVLNISQNDMTCFYWEDFYNFKYIHTIDVSHNQIVGFCNTAKYNVTFDKTVHLSLKDVIISFNKIIVLTQQNVERSSHIKYIDISNNPLHLVNINIFRYLRIIDLIIVPISGMCCLKHGDIQCIVKQVTANFNSACHIKINLFLKIIWSSLNVLGSLFCVFCLLYYSMHMRRGKCADALFGNNIFNGFLLFTFCSVYINIYLSMYTFNIVQHRLRTIGILVAQTSYIFSIMKDCTLTCKIIFPFRHQCRPLRFVPWFCVCVWVILISSGLLASSDRNKTNMINLNDDGKYKFAGVSYKTNMVILLVISVASILLMFTCYIALLLQNSSATRNHSANRKNKLHLNIFINLFFQSILTSAGICMLLFILSTKHTFKVNHLYLALLYYISAMRSFMVAACSVGIHALHILTKPMSWFHVVF